MGSFSDLPVAVRQHYEALQAETCSLRLDLAEAMALIDALEAELRRIGGRWQDRDDGQQATSTLTALIEARTLMRRALSPWRESSDGRRTEALRDLRVAEVAFEFLLRLRTVRKAAARP